MIAERFDTLRKAREVLLHPYSSKHVTHLLWDASYYEERIAANYRAYEDDYLHSKHTLMSENNLYRQEREVDALLQWQLRCVGPTAPSIPLQLRGIGSLLEYNVIDSAEDHRERAAKSHGYEDVLWNEDGTLEHDFPRLPEHSRSVEADGIGHALMRGCHLSFPDYHRNYLNQQSIRGRDQDGEHMDMEDDPRRSKSRELQNILSGEWDIDGNLA